MDYSAFRTELSQRRRTAPTRELTKMAYSSPNKLISLAEGMPNEETFPFTEIRMKLRDGRSFVLDGKELGDALQYIPTRGYPPLLQVVREFQKKSHSPPLWEDREVVVVAGGQDGLSKALESIVGPGDPILMPNPYYSGVNAVITPHQAEVISIGGDSLGLDPAQLRQVLQSRRTSGAKMPKLMYVNPTGANPTGTVLPLARRKEIYRLACEYDFLILEDDPYHYMYFTDEAPKSFLSLDTEARVIRLDSFSKIISSGLRIGFITAAAALVSSVELHMESSHLHAPTLSQVISYKLLTLWGYEGLMEHLLNVRIFYKKRRDIMSTLAKKHLHGLADFTVPSAGFFLWIKLRGVRDTWKMIMARGVSHGVLVVPGSAFMADSSKPCNTVRATFSRGTYEEMNSAMERLAKMIREELASNHTIENGNSQIPVSPIRDELHERSAARVICRRN